MNLIKDMGLKPHKDVEQFIMHPEIGDTIKVYPRFAGTPYFGRVVSFGVKELEKGFREIVNIKLIDEPEKVDYYFDEFKTNLV